MHGYSYALFMELIEDPTTSQMVCQESWEQTYKLIYGGFTNITQFVFPFITIIISYISIVIKLRERTAMGKPGSRFVINSSQPKLPSAMSI